MLKSWYRDNILGCEVGAALCLVYLVDGEWSWCSLSARVRMGHARFSDIEGTGESVSGASEPGPRSVVSREEEEEHNVWYCRATTLLDQLSPVLWAFMPTCRCRDTAISRRLAGERPSFAFVSFAAGPFRLVKFFDSTASTASVLHWTGPDRWRDSSEKYIHKEGRRWVSELCIQRRNKVKVRWPSVPSAIKNTFASLWGTFLQRWSSQSRSRSRCNQVKIRVMIWNRPCKFRAVDKCIEKRKEVTDCMEVFWCNSEGWDERPPLVDRLEREARDNVGVIDVQQRRVLFSRRVVGRPCRPRSKIGGKLWTDEEDYSVEIALRQQKSDTSILTVYSFFSCRDFRADRARSFCIEFTNILQCR